MDCKNIFGGYLVELHLGSANQLDRISVRCFEVKVHFSQELRLEFVNPLWQSPFIL